MTRATSEITFVQYLLSDFGIITDEPTKLFFDNKYIIHIVSNSIFDDE